MGEPYDEKKVKEIADELANQEGFKRRNLEIAEQRRIRFRQEPVNHPRIGPRLEVRNPLADQHIIRYAARFNQARLSVSVVPKGKESEESAENAKQYCMRAYLEMGRMVADPPVEMVNDTFSAHGVAWYRQRLNDGIDLEHLPEGRLVGVPFRLENPDPAAVYYWPDFSHVAEIGYLVGGNLNLQVGAAPEEAVRAAWKKALRVIRLETAEWVYDLTFKLGGRNMQDVRFHSALNPFHRPGYFKVAGRLTGSSDPALRYRSPVSDVYHYNRRKDLYDTMLNNAADLTGAPLFFLKRDASPSDPDAWLIRPRTERPEAKIDTGTGSVDVPEGYDLVPLSMSAGIDLVRAIENLRVDMGGMGFPDVLGVPQDVNAWSGYDRTIMERATNIYVEPLLNHHSDAWLEMFKTQLAALKEWQVEVVIRSVHGPEGGMFEPEITATGGEEVTVGPDDLEDLDLQVKFSAVTAESRIALQEEGMRLLDHDPPLLSVPEFLEHHRGVEDVPRALKLIDRDLRRDVNRDAAEAYLRGLLTERFGEVIAEPRRERRGRIKRPRPPKGQTAPGMGETLNQPTTPKTPPKGQPGLGEMGGRR